MLCFTKIMACLCELLSWQSSPSQLRCVEWALGLSSAQDQRSYVGAKGNEGQRHGTQHRGTAAGSSTGGRRVHGAQRPRGGSARRRAHQGGRGQEEGQGQTRSQQAAGEIERRATATVTTSVTQSARAAKRRVRDVD